MHVSVIPELCQGHARCWETCPEVFELDERGNSRTLVDEVPAEFADRVREAADNCPERAITLA
ncbi:MAG: ferredoxin [Nocardia sp.]|nr:ferredoxin [Nocardia sp.]